MEAVNAKSDLDAIRDFREEFEEELEKEVILKKIMSLSTQTKL